MMRIVDGQHVVAVVDTPEGPEVFEYTRTLIPLPTTEVNLPKNNKKTASSMASAVETTAGGIDVGIVEDLELPPVPEVELEQPNVPHVEGVEQSDDSEEEAAAEEDQVEPPERAQETVEFQRKFLQSAGEDSL